MEQHDSKQHKIHNDTLQLQQQQQQHHQILHSSGWEANLETEKHQLSRQLLRGLLMEDPINSTEQNEEHNCPKIQLLPMNKSLDRCNIIIQQRNSSCRNDKKMNNQNLCFLFNNELINKKIQDHPTNVSTRTELPSTAFSHCSPISATPLQLPSLIPSPHNSFMRNLSSPMITNKSKLPWKGTNKSTDHPQNISSSSSSYYPAQKLPDPSQIPENTEKKQTKNALNQSLEQQQSQRHDNPYFLGQSSHQDAQSLWDYQDQQDSKLKKKNICSQHQFKSEVLLEPARDPGSFTDRERAFRAQSTIGRDIPGKYKLLTGARFTSLEAVPPTKQQQTKLQQNQQSLHNRETYHHHSNDPQHNHILNATMRNSSNNNNNNNIQSQRYDSQVCASFCAVKQPSPLLHSNLRVVTKIASNTNPPIQMIHLRQTLFQRFLKGQKQQGQHLNEYERHHCNDEQGDMSNRRKNENKDKSLLANPGVKNRKKFSKDKESNVENSNKIDSNSGKSNNRSMEMSSEKNGQQQQHSCSQVNFGNYTRNRSKDKSPTNTTAPLNSLLKYEQQQSPRSSLPVINQDIQGAQGTVTTFAAAVFPGSILSAPSQRSSSLLNTSKEMLRSAKRNFALPLNNNNSNNSSCLSSAQILKDRFCLSPMNFV